MMETIQAQIDGSGSNGERNGIYTVIIALLLTWMVE